MAIFKEINWNPESKPTHEQVPQEELWEDGELKNVQVQHKIINNVMHTGEWILVREIER